MHLFVKRLPIKALPSLEELEERYQQHIRNVRVAQDALEEVQHFECTPEEYVLLEEALHGCEKEVRELEARLSFNQRILDQQKYGEDDLARIEERIEDINRRITRYERQVKVFEYILDGLGEARSKTVEVISQTISDEVGQNICHITDGRYSKVRRKEGELSFELFSPVKDDWVNPESELSTGTRDQLYLTARLAVLKAISGQRKLPVILDETLVSFDGARRQRAMQLLKQLAGEQVIITTCHDHYDTEADHLICL